MIIELLKDKNPDIFGMISNNPQAKQKLRSLETTWKQIQLLIQKDLQKTLKGTK
jgi:hypothetical protein